ncbi:succinate dehydrogenase assembly factor 2, mitochondrial-like [Ruditapes philippinarum]|uniref:succinate dehydrogenase assembly factor 2, mitochondrial-like n=1 Tax=Ruditapes philippinarum TaxID=129788 RepID=UPI00295B7716|nr:succinate dehydrogenase assembly factor 2, mitochondrial-like [Ruditapes philippinarum]
MSKMSGCFIFRQITSSCLRCYTTRLLKVNQAKFNSSRLLSDRILDPPDHTPPIPEYVDRGSNESIEDKKARLLYQSRKRGMTENGLLLSTFASLHLDKLSEEQLKMYDSLINKPTNDWEIYYWMIGNKPTPPEYDNSVMDMLKDHAKNKDRNVRLQQPALYT